MAFLFELFSRDLHTSIFRLNWIPSILSCTCEDHDCCTTWRPACESLLQQVGLQHLSHPFWAGYKGLQQHETRSSSQKTVCTTFLLAAFSNPVVLGIVLQLGHIRWIPCSQSKSNSTMRRNHGRYYVHHNTTARSIQKRMSRQITDSMNAPIRIIPCGQKHLHTMAD